MESIYTDITNPASLSGVKRLHDAVKNQGITNTAVKSFLEGEKSYTLHKVGRKRFRRRKYFTSAPGIVISADTAYMLQYTKSNDGCKYLIVFIDMYSRFLTVFPAKSLSTKDIIPILESFFTNSIHSYRKFYSDEGVEFCSKSAHKVYTRFGVGWYTTYSKEIKSGIVERVIKTLKNKISKYITLNNSERYIDVLDTIVETYNKTPHQGLSMRTPLDVHMMHNTRDLLRLSKILYKSKPSARPSSFSSELPEGKAVRLQSAKISQNPFAKSYFIQNTEEIFEISAVNRDHSPTTYNIRDLEGNEVKGVFYREELIPVTNTGLYDVEIIRSKKVGGKKKYLVKYIHYPTCDAQWLDEQTLTLKE